jgi:hypothetical protein
MLLWSTFTKYYIDILGLQSYLNPWWRFTILSTDGFKNFNYMCFEFLCCVCGLISLSSLLYLWFVISGLWARQHSQYSDWLRAGQSGDWIPVGARFSALVQTGPGAHPASCTMGTGSFPWAKNGWGVMLTPHPLLVPWSWKGRAIPLLPLWAVRPVQSLSACTRVHFTFTF